jgi:saccharopine dehydrogenase-like NADP-dependent oxidoreductase
MHNILIAGAGKIGSLIACLLSESKNYRVCLVDKHFEGQDVLRLKTQFPELETIEINVQDNKSLREVVEKYAIKAIISSLPYFCNPAVAEVAKQCKLHYFDLTEDVAVTERVMQLAKNAETAFVPQCGLAPGFINIVANSLMKKFDALETAKLRVGALPRVASNALNYALTWSTDGLINEYGNPCYAIEDGKEISVQALEGLELMSLDGESYEAFNTSGGLGNLAKTYAGKVQTLNYKTLRYRGHCEKMHFLMKDLKLNDDRETLKRILENAIPKTYQDMVLIYASVTGKIKGQLLEESYVKKVYPQKIAGIEWSAIQVTTASGMCSVVDSVLNNPNRYQGLIIQEQFSLEEVLNSPFGKCYC